MKKINDLTVYEENDKCALDEYSQQLEKDINYKIGKQDLFIQQLTNNQKLSSINNLENIIIKDATEANCDLKISGNSKQDAIATLDTPAKIKNCKDNVNLKLQNENLLIEGYSTPKSNTDFYSGTSSSFTPTKDGWGKFEYDNSSGVAVAYINTFLKLDYFRKRLKANTTYRIVIEFRNLVSNSIYDYFNICGGTTEEAFAEQRSYTSEQIKTNNKIVTYVTAKNEATLKNINLLLRSFVSVNKGSKFSVECRVLISEDTSIQSYILGKEKAILFPLQTNQKLMLGDYLADNGIHHVRKQITFDGTENWTKRAKNNNTFVISTGGKIIKTGLCTHYINFAKASEIDSKNGIYLSSTLSILITDLRFTNVADFKAELVRLKEDNKSLMVEIEFANKEDEEIEVFTEEQKEAYKQIKDLILYKGYNNLFCTDEISSIMSLNYIQSTEILLDNLQKQIDELKSLLTTTKTSAMLLNNLQNDLESEVM